MLFRRILPVLVLLGGLAGVAACLAGIAAAWVAGNRLRQANDVVFKEIDQSLATVRERILGAQRRTRSLQITTEDIRQGLEKWTQQEAAERLASEFDIEEKAQRLSAGLQEVNHLLELAATTMERVRQGMAFGATVGAPTVATIVDDVHEQMTSLGSQLKQVTETVNGLREGAAQIAAGAPLPERLNQLAQLALRAVATLGEIDVRFGRAAERLSAAQTRSHELKSKTRRWIVAGQVGAILVFAWSAAGQAALCALGWKRFRRGNLLRAETKAEAAPESDKRPAAVADASTDSHAWIGSQRQIGRATVCRTTNFPDLAGVAQRSVADSATSEPWLPPFSPVSATLIIDLRVVSGLPAHPALRKSTYCLIGTDRGIEVDPC